MTRSRTITVRIGKAPCSCGGTLLPVKTTETYDASAELGIPAEVNGSWVALHCDKCGQFALPGKILEELSDEAVLMLLRLERLLSGAEAKFLRKAALGIGQEELARRLGASRPTVARWEGARSLTGDHDFQLRGLVGAHLLKVSRLSPGPWKKRQAELVELLTGVLESARTHVAPARPPPLRIAA